MKTLTCVLLATALLVAAQADTLLRDSFEKPGHVRWDATWGPTQITDERAQDGQKCLKETAEDKYGLSVYSVALGAYPRTTYRASAWVHVPTQDKTAPPCLAFVRGDWGPVAAATTAEKDKWVELKIEYTVKSEPTLRLVLYQEGQKAGLGGAVLYWDNVRVDREMGEINMTDGSSINPYVSEGLQVSAAGGMKLTVAPGKIDVDGVAVTVPAETALELPAPRVIQIRDEASRLTDQEPKSYSGGTPLRGCMIEGIGLNGALLPASLVLKAEKGPAGRRFVEGKDWRADKTWGRVGRVAGGEIGADTDVFIDYDYSLQRVDLIEVRSDGQVLLRSGAEDKTIPAPARADQLARPLCNVYLPAGCRELTADLIYPIGPPYPAASEEEITHNASLIPSTLAKLEKGGDFTLLFWGDSVTCGGTSSTPERAFPQAFTTWLRGKYPQAHIRYVNAGTGGWNTDGKLPLIQEQVLDFKPDLVVIEFVNDMGMDREHLFKNHAAALAKLRAIGAEVIILTPHFTRPDWMGATGMRTKETRAAVGYFKEFAAENKVGLADASRRWEHLWIEGQPYITWLYNAINHPDDRGHWLFVEELQKFFP